MNRRIVELIVLIVMLAALWILLIRFVEDFT